MSTHPILQSNGFIHKQFTPQALFAVLAGYANEERNHSVGPGIFYERLAHPALLGFYPDPVHRREIAVMQFPTATKHASGKLIGTTPKPIIINVL
jgi:hypothetical protein